SPELSEGCCVSRATESCAHRIDEHQVTLVEQSVRIVCKPVGRWRQEAFWLEDHFAWTQRTHVKPKRGRSRAAIEGKRKRSLGDVLCIQGVGHIEHLGFDLTISPLDRKSADSCFVFQQIAVDL